LSQIAIFPPFFSAKFFFQIVALTPDLFDEGGKFRLNQLGKFSLGFCDWIKRKILWRKVVHAFHMEQEIGVKGESGRRMANREKIQIHLISRNISAEFGFLRFLCPRPIFLRRKRNLIP
jgi:hypothetical protein